MNKKTFFIVAASILSSLVVLFIQLWVPYTMREQNKALKEMEKVWLTPSISNNFSYKGEEGKDALTLLKEKASIEQEASGLVVVINSRKASADKREYWAFYVNGELAPVGPAQYVTKNGDMIEWKIETY